MKLLFICGGYYPDTSATGNCVKQIADKFTNNGESVYIICKSGSIDRFKEEVNRQEVHRITNCRLREWYKLCSIDNSYIRNFFTIIYKSFWAAFYLLMRDGLDTFLVKEYMSEINRVVGSEEIDAIIPCCMPAECLKAAYLCAKKTKMKIFPLLYDTYSWNVHFFRFKWNYKLRRHRAETLEQQLFAISTKVFYVDNWSGYFDQKPISNAIKVEHPLLVFRHQNPGVLRSRSKINAIYQGEINHQMRPPTSMLNCFDRIFDKDKGISLHICAYGNSVAEVEKAVKRHPDNIIFYGRVGKDVADELYDAADLSIVIANKDPNVVPSKIFECIASGYPIVYFYYTEEEKTYQLLQRYSLVFFYRQDDCTEDSIDKLMDWIEENYKKRLRYEDVAKVFSDATPDYVYEEIVKAIKEDKE